MARNRLLEPVCGANFGLVIEEVSGLRDVGMGASHVAGSRVIIYRLEVGVEESVECVDEVVDGDTATGADVERLASDVTLGRADVRLDGVVDEREVPRLLAIPSFESAYGDSGCSDIDSTFGGCSVEP